MTPGQLRVIFASFALALLGLTINALVFQPTRVAAVVQQSQPASTAAPARPAEPARPIDAAPKPPAAKPPVVEHAAAARPAAAPEPATQKPKPPAADTPSAITLARLAIEGTTPDRTAARPDPDVDLVRRVQKELLVRGYGPIITRDRLGPMLRAALMAWEYDNHLPITGQPTEALLERMTATEPPRRAPDAMARKVKSPEAEQVTRTIQHSLTALGHAPGAIDGQLSPDTERAIRAFETAQGIPPTGRVSAELFGRLARAMGARSSAGR